MGLRDVLRDKLRSALLGVSAYDQAPARGLDLDDPVVKRIREAMGGQLVPIPLTKLRWYLADLEVAQSNADSGNIEIIARLARAMRRDGTISGLMSTLTSGVVALPRKFYGPLDQIEALEARNGSRSVYDDMLPPSELELMLDDEEKIGVSVAELVPVEGRDFPIMIRLEPEFLRYRWQENRWYYNSVAATLPITPGDGRWILHSRARVAPWMAANWLCLGRAYVNKEHAILHRANYGMKLANAARYSKAPAGASEPDRMGMLARLMAWGVNTVFELPAGWDVGLLESKGEGYQVFQQDIDTSDREAAIAICGQVVTVDGGAGFQNSDIHRLIRGDKITRAAHNLAHTVNCQALPALIGSRWGVDAIQTGAIVEYDSRRPKDLKAEAESMGAAAEAIAKVQELLAKYGREVDIDEMMVRYGIPVRALKGDAPSVEGYQARVRQITELKDRQDRLIERARQRSELYRPPGEDVPDVRRAA